MLADLINEATVLAEDKKNTKFPEAAELIREVVVRVKSLPIEGIEEVPDEVIVNAIAAGFSDIMEAASCGAKLPCPFVVFAARLVEAFELAKEFEGKGQK